MVVSSLQTKEELNKWHIENDAVMGGVSTSSLSFVDEQDGMAHFMGHVSLENDGGFAQILFDKEIPDVSSFTGLELSLRGDGKEYQLRIETSAKDVGYSQRFMTKTNWEEVRLPFSEFTADHHGEKVPDAPPLDLKNLRTIGILIGNNKEEKFNFYIKLIRTY